MSVFPRRVTAPVASTSAVETIQHRLLRLRVEDDRRYGRQKPKARMTPREEGRAPFEAPASWKEAKADRATNKKRLRPEERRLVETGVLSGSKRGGGEEREVWSLRTCCEAAIVHDLRKRKGVLKEYVHLLPREMRVEVAELAGREGWSLSEEALSALLLRQEEGEEGDLPPQDEEQEVEDDWEQRFISHRLDSTAPAASLTRLDLSFSLLDLLSLNRLLFTASPTSRPTLNFPHLNTLLLTSTPNLTLHTFTTPNLFDTLRLLPTLRHLSLSGKTLQLPETDEQFDRIPDQAFLSRLAIVTGGLQTLDVSYMDWDARFLHFVEWEYRWRDLSVLGVLRDASQSEEVDEKGRRLALPRRCGGLRWTEVIESGDGFGGPGANNKGRQMSKKEIEMILMSRRGKWLEVIM